MLLLIFVVAGGIILVVSISAAWDGDSFDTLFLVDADVAYRDGSLFPCHRKGRSYFAVGGSSDDVDQACRSDPAGPSGPAGIGFESVALSVVDVGALGPQDMTN